MGKYDKLADGVTQLGEIMTDLSRRLDGIESRRADAEPKNRIEALAWLEKGYAASGGKNTAIARHLEKVRGMTESEWQVHNMSLNARTAGASKAAERMARETPRK